MRLRAGAMILNKEMKMENNNQDKRKDNALMQHEKYMKEAIKQAKKAYKLGEVPIGCVIVYEGKIIGRGYNRRKTDKNTLSHAEIIAIRKASRVYTKGTF